MLPPVQNLYNMIEEFTSQIKSLVKEQLAVVSRMFSDYMLSVYEIFVDNILNFTARLNSWVLPDNYELSQPHDASFYNVTLLKLIVNFSPFKLCSGITLPDKRVEINFDKHALPEIFNHFHNKTTDLKQPVFQDE